MRRVIGYRRWRRWMATQNTASLKAHDWIDMIDVTSVEMTGGSDGKAGYPVPVTITIQGRERNS